MKGNVTAQAYVSSFKRLAVESHNIVWCFGTNCFFKIPIYQTKISEAFHSSAIYKFSISFSHKFFQLSQCTLK